MTALDDTNSTTYALITELRARVDACDLMEAWNLMERSYKALMALLEENERLEAKLAALDAQPAEYGVHTNWPTPATHLIGHGDVAREYAERLTSGTRRSYDAVMQRRAPGDWEPVPAPDDDTGVDPASVGA